MIKILYMIDDLGFGGAQRQMVELLKNIDRDWIDPTLLVYHPYRKYAEELLSKNIPLDYIPKKFKYSPWYLARLIKYIRQTKPDIIHSFLQTPSFWARIGGKIGGCQIIITSIRNSRFPLPNLERYMSTLSSKIIVNSNATKINLINTGVGPNKIKVIHNGVDTRRFMPGNRTEKRRLRLKYGIPIDKKVFSLIGKFEHQKNHDCLITALRVMRINGDKLPVVPFIGETYDLNLYKKIKARIEKENLSDYVQFIPPTTSVEHIYLFSDVVVLPSLWEGCPNVLLESMSSGVPVIASDIPEIRQIVKNGENGLLFKSNNADELAACIIKMMKISDEDIGEMAAAGRQLVLEEYSVQKMALITMEVYKEELSRQRFFMR